MRLIIVGAIVGAIVAALLSLRESNRRIAAHQAAAQRARRLHPTSQPPQPEPDGVIAASGIDSAELARIAEAIWTLPPATKEDGQ